MLIKLFVSKIKIDLLYYIHIYSINMFDLLKVDCYINTL